MSSNKKNEKSEPKNDIVAAEPVKPKKRKLKAANAVKADNADTVEANEDKVNDANVAEASVATEQTAAETKPEKSKSKKAKEVPTSDDKPIETEAKVEDESSTKVKSPKKEKAKKTKQADAESDADSAVSAEEKSNKEKPKKEKANKKKSKADKDKAEAGDKAANEPESAISNDSNAPVANDSAADKKAADDSEPDQGTADKKDDSSNSKAEKENAIKPAPSIEMGKIIAEEKEKEQEVSDRLDRIASTSPFAKYDEIYTQAEEEEDRMEEDNVKPTVPPTIPVIEKKVPPKIVRNRRRHDERPEFLIDDDSASISTLTKGNVWDVDVDGIYNMLIEGRKTIHWAENRNKYMNIIRPVFDIQFINKSDKHLVASLEESKFKIFGYPSSADDTINAIAIRKHQIKKITDLTMENIWHLSPVEVLELIKNNLGTGWKGLPLPIQDIIESAFYVDSSTLPQAAMHRKGGIIDRRKSNGYEALEIARGTWIEAIFLKEKPKMEKEHFSSSLSSHSKSDKDDDDDSDNDEELDEDIDNNDDVEDDDEDISIDEENPQIEDFEDIASAEDVEDEGVDDE